VIWDVDDSVRAWLSRYLPEGVPIVFDPPHRCADRPGELLSVFLDDIEEDYTGVAATWGELRDNEGHLVGRRPPGRRYRFTYLVTAWADGTEREHHLLGGVLLGCASCPSLPADALRGMLARDGHPVPVRGAPHRDGPEPARDPFGPVVRTSIRLQVLVPYVSEALTDLAPAPRQVAVNSAGLPPAAPAPRRGRGISEVP
jgi:hypothetical protein